MADNSKSSNGPARRKPPAGDPPPWRIEGSRTPPSPGGEPEPVKPHRSKRVWIFLVVALTANLAIAFAIDPEPRRVTVPYSVFRTEAGAGNVAEVSAEGETIQGTFRQKVRYPDKKGTTPRKEFKTERPTFADDEILAVLLQKKAVVNAKPVDDGRSIWWTLLIGFVPTLLLVGFFVWMMRRTARAMGGGGLGGSMMGSVGRTKARKYERNAERTTFADVAGIDEATEELAEVVDFLKHPDRYRRLGGMIPKGVLLTGLPGTGKTLLARAVAGEADVPFYSLSASEFVEMFVGVGASRVRDLFEQAKKDAPAIIFIDELDAIGRARGSGGFGGTNEEREQTLNQILTEIDGFDGSEGVIVLSATNRPEILDPALLRAGRFDRRIQVNPPDQDGRLQILKVHTRSVPLADPKDLEWLASTSPGMVGADLRNLVNEAALGAARRGHETVEREDLTSALERVVLGAARRLVLSEDDRRRTAYHEAGHALLGMLLPGADPVRKVSIIPRGRALGVTYQSPDADRYGYSESYLRGKVIGLLGGHAAEELVYDDTTTGVESDLEQATSIARQMVGRWGMSDRVGYVSALPRPGDEHVVLPGSPGAPAQHTLELIDDEVKRLTDDAHGTALRLLGEHRDQLDALAAALLERETLDETEAYAAAGIPVAVVAAV